MQPEKIIRLSKSTLGVNEKQAVLDVLDKEFLGMGKEVQIFEEMLTEYFESPVVCVVNGTAALHLALQAIGAKPNDEVLVPSLTYVSSFQAISASGASPIACDINENTLTIDLKDAESKLTPNTIAIMPVHYSAGIENLDEIYNFARKFNLRVIEDAAHAFGSICNNKKIGSTGDITCFSFDGIKNITSGEGGCIITKDENVLHRVRDARLLGVEKDTEKRYKGERTWEFDVKFQGWRYHMSNIMAAIGIEQFKRFSTISNKRKSIAKYYDSLLKNQKGIYVFDRNYEFVVPHIYVIRIPNLTERKDLQNELLKNGIQTGYHYQPNHTHTYFKNSNRGGLEVTEKIFPELLTLPMHEELSFEEVEFVCLQLLNYLQKNL